MFLKVDNDGAELMSSGRLFQATRPVTQNARLLMYAGWSWSRRCMNWKGKEWTVMQRAWMLPTRQRNAWRKLLNRRMLRREMLLLLGELVSPQFQLHFTNVVCFGVEFQSCCLLCVFLNSGCCCRFFDEISVCLMLGELWWLWTWGFDCLEKWDWNHLGTWARSPLTMSCSGVNGR